MNWILYFKMWIMFGEKPPKSVLLVGSRKPTSAEIEYGKSLERRFRNSFIGLIIDIVFWMLVLSMSAMFIYLVIAVRILIWSIL